MPPWVLYLLALVTVALAQGWFGSRSRVVLWLIAFTAAAEAWHVLASYVGSSISVVASVLVLVVLLPWAVAAGVLAWHPKRWHNGATSIAASGSYLAVLLIGLIFGDMTGLIPQ